MIRSMTGYGRGKYSVDGREYVVEIKSVNNRYCDINVKLPRSISYLEEKIKEQVGKKVTRGKVDIFITFYNNSTRGKKISFNNELIQLYLNELNRIAEENDMPKDIKVTELTKFPDVLNIENEEDEELIWTELQKPLSEALDNFVEMRQKEGEKLYQDLEKRISHVEENVNIISENSTRLIQDYVVKLEGRIKELLGDQEIDQNRLAMETVIYADKSSVEEEVTRLKSHVSQFRDLIKQDVAGKKLDFLIQEMNRETNTIGSKSGSLDITNIVINTKTELEDIREQVQNIE